MKPLLKLFGAKYGNGLSPFDVDMDIPGDIIKLIKHFFHTPNRYPREKQKYNDSSGIFYGNVEAVDSTPPVSIHPGFVEDIKPPELGEENEYVSIDISDEETYNDSDGI